MGVILMKKVALLIPLILFLIPTIVLADNNTTAINFTLPSCNQCTWLDGNVVNIVWKPSWSVNLGEFNCTFIPYEGNTLEESYYVLECELPWNITTRSSELALIPVELLEGLDVATITEDRKKLGESQALNFGLGIWAIFATIALILYYLYENWWTERVDQPFTGDVSIPGQEGKSVIQKMFDGFEELKQKVADMGKIELTEKLELEEPVEEEPKYIKPPPKQLEDDDFVEIVEEKKNDNNKSHE